MYKRVVILQLLLSLNGFSQINLVPNSSFEYFTSCPTSQDQVFLAFPWDKPTNGNSDYFNACASATGPVNVPYPAYGNIYQQARTGVAYTGFIAYDASEYREYIQTELTDTLSTGKKYCVNFYVNYAGCCVTANNIGAYFSTSHTYINTSLALPFTPQIENNPFNQLTDTANWTLISGWFIAAGNEKYLIIGNFNNHADTDTTMLLTSIDSCTCFGAYYFIDDVSVYLCEDTVQPPQNLFIPTYIKNEEYFYITGLPANSNLQVYNAIGQIVFKENNYTQKLNTQQLSTGIYFYNLQLPSGEAYRGKVYFEK